MLKKLLINILKYQKKGLVLAGHGVYTQISDPKVESVHISFENFKKSIDALIELEYDFLSMRELINISKNNFKYHKHWTHLTFDDGYENNFEVIYPYLKEKKIPFSIFVSTHHSQRNIPFYTYMIRAAILNTKEKKFIDHEGYKYEIPHTREERLKLVTTLEEVFKYLKPESTPQFLKNINNLLTQSEWTFCSQKYPNDKLISKEHLLAMKKSNLIHIGSHSHEHLIFHNSCSESWMEYQLEISKDIIQKSYSENEYITFCYPNGGIKDFTANSMSLTKKIGYDLSFISLPRYVDSKTNPQAVTRFWLSTNKKIFIFSILMCFGNFILRLIKNYPIPLKVTK